MGKANKTGRISGLLQAGLILAVLPLAGCASLLAREVTTDPSGLESGSYTLEKTHAALLWKVSHLGISTFVGRFNDFDAKLVFNPEKPEASKLDVVIQAASLDVNQPDFAETLRGENWFDTENYPEIRFTGTAVEVTGENMGRVTGDLTLLGRTKPLTLDIIFHGGTQNVLTGKFTLGFQASGIVERTEFGMSRLAPKVVGPEVTLEIHAEFAQNE